MTTPNPTPPSWWQTQLAGIEKWALLHWTYIVVAIIANLIGVVFHF